MSLWEQLGFSGNPYDVDPLPATEEGAQLLVGRDKEVRTLLSQLESMTTHPTVEGENGVGKTSLAFVAAYEGKRAFINDESNQLLIPLSRPLQLGGNYDDFNRQAIFTIARTFIDNEELLSEYDFAVPSDLSRVKKWLDLPTFRSGGGNVSAMGFGAGAQRSESANTSTGFSEVGFQEAVQGWLSACFPEASAGGFVGVVDNLELLQTSSEARKVLEQMRDNTLSIKGMRWILCGAKGIVRSAASSPRMAGRLSRPMEVLPVPENVIADLIQRRIAYFAISDAAKAPVSPEAFLHLYTVSNRNLRDALKHSQDFAIWLDVNDELSRAPEDLPGLLEAWLAYEADLHFESRDLQPRQWKLFDKLADRGGACAPGDFEEFGFTTPQHMRTNFARLEQANLVDATIDESDKRRRTVSITSMGWLVRYRRSQFQQK